MARSDIPDDSKVIQALKEGHHDEAARRIREDLDKIEHAGGTPQQKLAKEQAYLEQLQGNALRDQELQRLGFSGLQEIWNYDTKGHKSAPRLMSDSNHDGVLDDKDFQVDLSNTVLGDKLTGHTLRDRSQSIAAKAGQLRAMTPTADHSLDNVAKPQNGAGASGGMLQGKIDASAEGEQPKVFKLGGEQTFLKSSATERLPGGKVIDWTKWHHDMVFAAKHEFDQLLAQSPDLKAHAGSYAPTGHIKLQFDAKRDGGIEFRGCEGASFYGADPNAQATFERIARQTVERLNQNPGLRFPPGSQRTVNSTELEIGLSTGQKAQWQRNDRERTRS